MQGQRRSQIIWDDMLYRDERAFNWIQSRRDGDGFAQFTLPALADAMRCHENTARAIVSRLIGANMLEVERRQYNGYVYRIVKPQ